MLPSASYLITEEYSIRRATKHEKKQAWQVINSCFLLDTCWNDVLNEILPRIRHEFEKNSVIPRLIALVSPTEIEHRRVTD